jgi:hypothetical protein
MQKSGIIVWVWAQPFFLVHMQKSGIIIEVWDQPFFLVHVEINANHMCLFSAIPNIYDYP